VVKQADIDTSSKPQNVILTLLIDRINSDTSISLKKLAIGEKPSKLQPEQPDTGESSHNETEFENTIEKLVAAVKTQNPATIIKAFSDGKKKYPTIRGSHMCGLKKLNTLLLMERLGATDLATNMEQAKEEAVHDISNLFAKNVNASRKAVDTLEYLTSLILDENGLKRPPRELGKQVS